MNPLDRGHELTRQRVPLSLAGWRGHVDLCSAAAVEEFAAKEKQRDGNQDYKNNEHGDDAGTGSTTF